MTKEEFNHEAVCLVLSLVAVIAASTVKDGIKNSFVEINDQIVDLLDRAQKEGVK
jgi:hypothetical protein